MRKRHLIALLAAVSVTVVTPASEAAPPLQVPALTRIASHLSGLRQKQRIRVQYVSAAQMQARARAILDREYPRDQQAYDETLYRAVGLLETGATLRPALLATYTSNVRGLYDPVARRLYVRRGVDLRQAVLHELVHALQDQTFDLRRLSNLRRGQRDAGLAATAAVEGTTLLTSRPVATRALQSHSGNRARLFVELERDFSYATGLRFATTLRSVGGNANLYSALRRFPTTTEQIFHVDKFLRREEPTRIDIPERAAGLTLQRTDTFGELDVRALLAIFQVPRLDHAGEGWGGGRTALYTEPAGGRAVAIALTWESERDAQEWEEAAATYLNEAFDAETPGQPPRIPCPVATVRSCWNLNGHPAAFARNGQRTALVFGELTAASTLAQTLTD